MLLIDAIGANRDAINHATKPQLRKLLPVLKQAEREMTTELGKWLYRNPPTAKYDKHRHRSLIAQLHGAISTIEGKVSPAFTADTEHDGEHAQHIAMNRLLAMVEAGSAQFEAAIRPLRIDVAAVMTNERKTMVGTFSKRAKTYSNDVIQDIHSRLMLGVVRGETVDQLTSRLLQSTGLIKAYKARGPNAIAEGAAGKVFNTYRWWAESIARTELVNAYASVQAKSLKQANREDPGWLMMWDAANDARVCRWCNSLDRETVAPDESFRVVGRFGARPHPPLHTCCRCALIPWRAEWNPKRGRN